METPHFSKSEWQARVESTRLGWNDLVAAVGDRVNEPGAMGDWTFHDLAAHLNGWRVRTVDRLEAAANGVPVGPAPWPAELEQLGGEDAALDEINAWFQTEGSQRTYADLLSESNAQFGRIQAALERIPEERLYDPAFVPWLDGYTVADVLDGSWGHLMEDHLGEVKEWIRTSG